MRFLSDFGKSSIAFGLGTGIVVLAVAINTGWQIDALFLTSGIPLLVYGIWAFFDRRQARLKRMRDALELVLHKRRVQARKVVKANVEILFGQSPNDNPLAYIPTPHRGERRVLLPRDHEVTKQRILQGRGEYISPDDEVNELDQWHD